MSDAIRVDVDSGREPGVVEIMRSSWTPPTALDSRYGWYDAYGHGNHDRVTLLITYARSFIVPIKSNHTSEVSPCRHCTL
jgi:hypothetical protein